MDKKIKVEEGILLDNRPDFFDVVSHELTGKTVKQHVQNVVNKKTKTAGQGKQKDSKINKNYNKPDSGSGNIKVKNSTVYKNPNPSNAGAINTPSNSATGYIKKAGEAFEESLKTFDNLLIEACSKLETLQAQKEKNEKGMKETSLPAQKFARAVVNKAIEKKIKDLDEGISSLDTTLENINTATSAFAPYPTTLAGKEQPSKSKKGKEKKAMLGYKYMKIRKAE